MNSCFGGNCISGDEDPIRVLITGFAPFADMETNLSWEGVMSLNKEEIESKFNVNLTREEFKVRYGHVDASVPKLCDKLQPDLIIHVGASETTCLVLEKKACKGVYDIEDDEGVCPVNNENSSEGPEVVCTHIDLELLRKEYNTNPAEGLDIAISEEAGKFLCEYIYYTSLCRLPKTLFVHVPYQSFTPEQIAQGLERILECCIRQLYG